MIREEFLESATRDNLYGLRLLRDVATVLQTGVRVRNLDALLALERMKLRAESLLEKAVTCSVGFVSAVGDTGYLTQYTSNCEARTSLLGVEIKLSLVAAERQTLKSGARPPVGMRGTLFDVQKELSLKAAAVSDELTEFLSATVRGQSEGRLLSGFSLTLLSAFKSLSADYAVTSAAFAADGSEGLLSRPEIVACFCREAERSVDKSEEKLLMRLSESGDEKSKLSLLAAASAGGAVKSTLPPLFFDFAFRYALWPKVLTTA